jgi:glycosyltransferase involved in cell wall biosynthesis
MEQLDNIFIQQESYKSAEPLVSIIVITYNTSKYVLETLASVNCQTYKNIELIVSDDCSTDNTVEICREWIKSNSTRFLQSRILLGEKNSGISANCNKGIKEAKGAWIKLIAGDDILHKDAILKCLNYIKIFPNVEVLSANVIRFKFDKINEGVSSDIHLHPFFNENVTASDQYQFLLRFNRIPAPAVIIKKRIFEEISLFDESIHFIEDYPLWIKITENNIKIFNIPDSLVCYRIHETSISQTNKLHYRIDKTNEILLEVQKKYILKRLPFIERLGLFQTIISTGLILKIGNKRKGILETSVYYLFKYTNIFSIYRKLVKIFNLKTKYRRYW